MVNTSEEITNITAAAVYLPEDYVTRKILTLLGDGDKAEELLRQMTAENLENMGNLEETE